MMVSFRDHLEVYQNTLNGDTPLNYVNDAVNGNHVTRHRHTHTHTGPD